MRSRRFLPKWDYPRSLARKSHKLTDLQVISNTAQLRAELLNGPVGGKRNRSRSHLAPSSHTRAAGTGLAPSTLIANRMRAAGVLQGTHSPRKAVPVKETCSACILAY